MVGNSVVLGSGLLSQDYWKQGAPQNHDWLLYKVPVDLLTAIP